MCVLKYQMDDVIDHSDVPEKEKEKYKTWVWNAFDEKRKIILGEE